MTPARQHSYRDASLAGFGLAAVAGVLVHLLTKSTVLQRNNYALSAMPLSHLETPWRPALLLYPDFSCGVQRNSTRAVAGFLMGGLPLGRLGWFMALIMPVQIIVDKCRTALYYVRTVNQPIRRQT